MSPHWPTQTMVFQKRPDEQTAVDVPRGDTLSRYFPVMRGVHYLAEQIEEGSFYEINRTKLPPQTPSLLLQSVRVVMVTVKTDQHVTIRYPSTRSMDAYLVDTCEKLYPEMDEKYVMGSELAAQVLARRIPSHEFSGNGSLKAFWVVESPKTEAVPVHLRECNFADNVKSKVGTCLSRLQCSNIKSWGERRLVSYIRNGEKNSSEQQCSHNSSHVGVKTEIPEEGCVGMNEFKEHERRSFVSDDHEEEEMKVERIDEVSTKIQVSQKRKRSGFAKSRSIKNLVHQKKSRQSKATQKLSRDNFRWSAQRYENAKSELLAVMKTKHADYWNPISRHTLRSEARKHIGDTGLLDHLLKHVVDTLAPGGNERFKRRWDSQGVMEYWLESADLDDIRKNAGVQDPNWTPPPGWKPGDPICNHGSNCSMVINALKEELAKLRGKLQVTTSQKQEDEQNLPAVGTIRERYEDLLKEKVRREKELLEISKSLKNMEVQLMSRESGGLDGQSSYSRI